MMAKRGSRVGNVKVSGVKTKDLSNEGIRKVLTSDAVADALAAKAEEIAQAMNAEGRGEFRSGKGTHGENRAHAFVNTYDRHARATANKDPSIFGRHRYGK